MLRFFTRQKERAYIFDIWSTIGYKPFDRRVNFFRGTKKKLIHYNFIENYYLISPHEFNTTNVEKIKKLLKNIGPFFLTIRPSVLFQLIEELGEKFFLSLPIRGVLAGGEIFTTEQIKLFKKKFEIPFSHWYGQSEYCSLAKYCEKCSGFHFYPTYGFTELVPVGNNIFKIIATSFNKIGTQFVRYDTGDLAVIDEKICETSFLRIKSIIGRSVEYFFDKNGKKYSFGNFLFSIHDDFWEKIRSIQFIHEYMGKMLIKIVIKDKNEVESINSFLKDRFKMLDVEFKYVSNIERTNIGKHKYFINKIKQL